MTLVGVYREPIFSPGKVREDAAILDATLQELSCRGYEGRAVEAEALETLSPGSGCVLSMAQSDRALTILEAWSRAGTRVINSPQSVRNCYRRPLLHNLEGADAPMPPTKIVPLDEVESNMARNCAARYWLKRGDVHAMDPADVVEVSSRRELHRALHHFREQGVEAILVQEHVDGKVIKFYGVGPDEYFSAFVSDSLEEVTSQMSQLSAIARRCAQAVGLEVFGGDAILARGGEVVLIDLNDWPSFSRCCRDAAKSIARYVRRICDGGFHGPPNGP